MGQVSAPVGSGYSPMRSGKLPHPVSFVAVNVWIYAAFSLLNLNL